MRKYVDAAFDSDDSDVANATDDDNDDSNEDGNNVFVDGWRNCTAFNPQY